VKAQNGEVGKSAKYQDLCHAMGLSFVSVIFESQSFAGQRFLELVRQADEIGEPIASPKISRSPQLSVTLQRSVAQAINIGMATLYTRPTGPTAVDGSTWSGVVGARAGFRG